MKKLSFLIYILSVTLPTALQTRFIEVTAPNGKVIHVSDSETIESFFEKCRKDNHCKGAPSFLMLDFNGKLIREGTYDARRTFYSHSQWNSKTAVVATLVYPSNNFEHLANRLIDIQAPNGKIKQCALNETPAYFFRQCRSSGNCSDFRPMVLRLGHFEIKEDSEAANRPFSSFNTSAGSAQATYQY